MGNSRKHRRTFARAAAFQNVGTIPRTRSASGLRGESVEEEVGLSFYTYLWAKSFRSLSPLLYEMVKRFLTQCGKSYSTTTYQDVIDSLLRLTSQPQVENICQSCVERQTNECCHLPTSSRLCRVGNALPLSHLSSTFFTKIRGRNVSLWSVQSQVRADVESTRRR